MIRKISSLILIAAICLLYVTGCRQVVVYEYELSGIIKSASGNKVIVEAVSEYASDNEYEYWFGEENSYFNKQEAYKWSAVYPVENSSIELTVSKEWLESNSLDAFVDFSGDGMINFTIENDTITDMQVTEVSAAYRREFDYGVRGEFYPDKNYTVMTLNDAYSVFWRVYISDFNIYMYNADGSREYNLNITDLELARCYLLNSDDDRIDLWIDGFTESLHISIADEVTLTAYEGGLMTNEDGTISNELLEEKDSHIRVIDFTTGKYLPINYK